MSFEGCISGLPLPWGGVFISCIFFFAVMMIFCFIGCRIFFSRFGRHFCRDWRDASSGKSSVDILNGRLARGEISADEYEKVLKVLKRSV